MGRPAGGDPLSGAAGADGARKEPLADAARPEAEANRRVDAGEVGVVLAPSAVLSARQQPGALVVARDEGLCRRRDGPVRSRVTREAGSFPSASGASSSCKVDPKVDPVVATCACRRVSPHVVVCRVAEDERRA